MTAAEPASDAAPAPDPEAEHEPAREVAPEPEGEPEPEPETATARDERAAEPRRGFFARLFGRRRARVQPSEAIEVRLATDLDRPADEPKVERADEPKAELVHPSEPGDAFAAVRQALSPETFPASQLFATRPEREPRQSTKATVPQTPPEQTADAPQPLEPQAGDDSQRSQAQAADISAELMAAEEVASEEVTAVLTAVLDRLGAAHHRPFSRA